MVLKCLFHLGASPTNISAYGIESKVDIRFHCNGEEQSLSECSASLVTCQTNNVVAGLICGGNNDINLFMNYDLKSHFRMACIT